LKFDLKEVIKLTHDLIKSQQQEKRQANGMDAKDPILLAVLANKWKVGDQCMAPWSEDGKWVPFIYCSQLNQILLELCDKSRFLYSIVSICKMFQKLNIFPELLLLKSKVIEKQAGFELMIAN